ncbi:MAG: hypothetical protein KIH63_004930 [Candidatus Saccharibacteria bacterium]|nr:hypothetical protein [Candidatus Saccharibacteria bacterium]
MLKKIIVFLANSFLSLCLLLAVMSAVILAVFNGGNLKKWLNEGQVYDNIVPALLEEAEQAVEENPENGQINPLKDPGVQAAAQAALSPAFLKTNTEEVVDSIDAWLKGEISQPAFTIELSEAKNTFAAKVGTYATERYAALPDCAPGQIPDTSDVLKVACKVPGYDPAADVQKAVDDLKNSQEFLPDTTITASDVKIGEGSDTQPLFQKLEGLPRLYQLVQAIPYVFGFLALGGGVVVLFASETKRRGVKTIASTVVPVGLVLFLQAWLVSVGMDRLYESVNNSTDAGQGLKTVAVNGLQGLGNDFWRSLMTFAVIVTLIGLAMVVGLLVTRQKNDSQQPESTKPAHEEPATEPEPEAAVSPEPKEHKTDKPSRKIEG